MSSEIVDKNQGSINYYFNNDQLFQDKDQLSQDKDQLFQDNGDNRQKKFKQKFCCSADLE